MSDEQRDPEEEQGPRRPRVVDKRISARRAAEGASPSPAPPQDEAPPGADVRAPREGPGAVKAPDPPGPTSQEGTFRPPPPPEGPPGAPAGEQVWTPEQEAEAQRIVAEIDRVPAHDWVINSAMNLVNVAGVKLDRGDPEGAQLAIDALAAILDATGARLGDAHAPLRQVLAQLQMAYAQTIQPPGAPGGV